MVVVKERRKCVRWAFDVREAKKRKMPTPGSLPRPHPTRNRGRSEQLTLKYFLHVDWQLSVMPKRQAWGTAFDGAARPRRIRKRPLRIGGLRPIAAFGKFEIF